MDGRICSIFSGLHFIMRSVLSTKGRELTGEGADLQWESGAGVGGGDGAEGMSVALGPYSILCFYKETNNSFRIVKI